MDEGKWNEEGKCECGSGNEFENECGYAATWPRYRYVAAEAGSVVWRLALEDETEREGEEKSLNEDGISVRKRKARKKNARIHAAAEVFCRGNSKVHNLGAAALTCACVEQGNGSFHLVHISKNEIKNDETNHGSICANQRHTDEEAENKIEEELNAIYGRVIASVDFTGEEALNVNESSRDKTKRERNHLSDRSSCTRVDHSTLCSVNPITPSDANFIKQLKPILI